MELKENREEGIEEDIEDIFDSGWVLLFDADILVYKPCCIFNDDTTERTRELLKRNIDNKIEAMCNYARVSRYRLFLTTKDNFRNYITDDYKANRVDVERPVNLTFAKKYIVNKYNAEYVKYLEADDLLAINQKSNTIIWSPDKDLRQVAGWHLCDNTNELVFVQELGEIIDGKKPKFNGVKGLYYQALVGDNADYILGCAKRVSKVYKSGKKKGQEYLARAGIGPKQAISILNLCEQNEKGFLEAVAFEYTKIWKSAWKENLEKQMNLLYMIRDYDGKYIKKWTADKREEYMELKTGELCTNKEQ